MRSDGATCGYCACLPTRHSKKDARFSSDSLSGIKETAHRMWEQMDSESYFVDPVVSSSSSRLSDESSPETDL